MADGRGRVVAAATDGACSGNPGPGGWGALLRFEDGSVEEFGGYAPATTNNRMELQAALHVLEQLKDLPCHPDLKIRTDSKYLIDGLSKWMAGWKRTGWRTAAGKPVLNQDLWRALDRARLDDVPLAYVKGHSGDPDNERVDQIAVSFSKGGGAPALMSGQGQPLLHSVLLSRSKQLEMAKVMHLLICSGCSQDWSWLIVLLCVAMASAWLSWPSWWSNQSSSLQVRLPPGVGAIGYWSLWGKTAGGCAAARQDRIRSEEAQDG